MSVKKDSRGSSQGYGGGGGGFGGWRRRLQRRRGGGETLVGCLRKADELVLSPLSSGIV
jgi:hypothetical protein